MQKLRLNHLLSIDELTKDQILAIMDLTLVYQEMMTKTKRLNPILAGRTIALLFYEPSTRTKCSFEIAASYLGAHPISISKQGSSFVKGETLKDTAWNLIAMGVDLAVMRHPVSGAAYYLSEHVNIPVVNAGDGMHAHPTQALLDLATMIQYGGSVAGKTVTIAGDIRHSRVARSNIHALTKCGANVQLVGPNTFMPPGIETLGAKIIDINDTAEAIKHSDIVMGLRIQKERQLAGYIPSAGEYAKFFGIKPLIIADASKDIMIMHPGPMNRGIELTSEIADGDHSYILRQVPNGTAVRMAILAHLLGGENHA